MTKEQMRKTANMIAEAHRGMRHYSNIEHDEKEYTYWKARLWGIDSMLMLLDIPYSYSYNDDNEIESVTVGNITVNIYG